MVIAGGLIAIAIGCVGIFVAVRASAEDLGRPSKIYGRILPSREYYKKLQVVVGACFIVVGMLAIAIGTL